MENLELLGVQEMDTKETREIEGGWWFEVFMAGRGMIHIPAVTEAMLA